MWSPQRKTWYIIRDHSVPSDNGDANGGGENSNKDDGGGGGGCGKDIDDGGDDDDDRGGVDNWMLEVPWKIWEKVSQNKRIWEKVELSSTNWPTIPHLLLGHFQSRGGPFWIKFYYRQQAAKAQFIHANLFSDLDLS